MVNLLRSFGSSAILAAIRRASLREDWKQKHGGLPDGVARPLIACGRGRPGPRNNAFLGAKGV